MLISCPECTQKISDKSEFCINCGCPFNAKTNSINESVNCLECKSELISSQTNCSNCGCPNESSIKTQIKSTSTSEQHDEYFFYSVMAFSVQALLFGSIGAVFGFVSAQYFPFFGGFATLGEPYSPARNSLVPGHVILFFSLFAVMSSLFYLATENRKN